MKKVLTIFLGISIILVFCGMNAYADTIEVPLDYATIQAAIDAAISGDTINVAAGTYVGPLLINKPLTIRGATWNVNKNGYMVPTSYAWDDSVESIINHPNPSGGYITIVDIYDTDDVTFEGFVVQELDAVGNLNSSLIRVYAHTQEISNIVVRNNVIGPNTSLTSQDGKQGRMGLYIVNHPYDDNGVVHSTFAGNKIFDCKGNGDNIFIWSSYFAYGAPGPASMMGTVIEDNEIYGSHRAGIETAGGYSDLTIRNNKIYGNTGLPSDNPNHLKYGNGILLIRGSSDKVGGPTTAYGPENLTIEGNQIYNNEKNGIYMGPINHNYTITCNAIYNNGWDAIQIDLEGTYWNPTFEPVPGEWSCYDGSSNILANNNNITGNNYGARVIGAPTNGFVLDAEYNWWGDALGPSGAGPGSGDGVSANVDFDPWMNMYYGDVSLSGGFQSGHFADVWDLTTEDLVISFTYDANGLVDDSGGSAHAWSELGLRTAWCGDFNPTAGKGVWLATDYDWAVDTFDPDPAGFPTQDLDDKLILQKAGGQGEGAYNLPSTPPNPWANYRIWWDRDGVDPWQNPETANTGGIYNIEITLHATSNTSGEAYMRINGLYQGFETDSNWNTIELIPAGMTFTGDMTQMQVFYGLYGYGATHSVEFKEIMVKGCCLGSIIKVAIDIKPGSEPNAINLGSKGVIPVAILSSGCFDATTVDPGSVKLAGSGVAVRGKADKLMAHLEDVNGDGLVDLVVQVETENLDPLPFQAGHAILTGTTYNGVDIVGSDYIIIVKE